VSLADGTQTIVIPDDVDFENPITSALAVDGDYVYWQSTPQRHELMRAGLDGRDPTIIAEGIDAGADFLAIAGGSAFFNDGGLMRVPLDGTAVESISRSGFSFAVDTARVYWTEHGDSSSSLMMRPIDGGVREVFDLPLGVEPQTLAVDDSNVYFVDAIHDVYRLPKGAKTSPAP
jgi:hypothetical protein